MDTPLRGKRSRWGYPPLLGAPRPRVDIGTEGNEPTLTGISDVLEAEEILDAAEHGIVVVGHFGDGSGPDKRRQNNCPDAATTRAVCSRKLGIRPARLVAAGRRIRARSLIKRDNDEPCISVRGRFHDDRNPVRDWIPIIMKSPAYRDAGLIIITFDEAASADASACCNEPSGPNTKLPGAHGPGGGRVGAVVLSPFIRPGTVSKVPYNHYSMLRSVENLFGLKHIGYAGRPGLVPFGADVYTRPRRAK